MTVRLHSIACVSLIAAAISLGGCSSVRNRLDPEENPGPCPRAFGLYDAARIVNFAGDDVTPQNVTFTAEIQDVRSLCRYGRDGGPIEADLKVTVGYGRGEAATANQHTYQMFVAVTRTDRAVIAKEVFPVQVKFGRKGEVVYRVEEFDKIVIPRAKSTTSGTNFEILVGFEQSPEQIEFNRLGTRFTYSGLDD